MEAYEDMIRHTAAKHGPWYVVAADNQWFTRIVIAAALIKELWSLGLDFPKVDRAQRDKLQGIREEIAKN